MSIRTHFGWFAPDLEPFSSIEYRSSLQWSILLAFLELSPSFICARHPKLDDLEARHPLTIGSWVRALDSASSSGFSSALEDP